MAEREEILRIVLEAVDVFNGSLVPEERIERSEWTPVFGEASILDSLSVLRLILGIETRLVEARGGPTHLADRLVTGEAFPPMTVGALATRIAELRD